MPSALPESGRTSSYAEKYAPNHNKAVAGALLGLQDLGSKEWEGES